MIRRLRTAAPARRWTAAALTACAAACVLAGVLLFALRPLPPGAEGVPALPIMVGLVVGAVAVAALLTRLRCMLLYRPCDDRVWPCYIVLLAPVVLGGVLIIVAYAFVRTPDVVLRLLIAGLVFIGFGVTYAIGIVVGAVGIGNDRARISLLTPPCECCLLCFNDCAHASASGTLSSASSDSPTDASYTSSA